MDWRNSKRGRGLGDEDCEEFSCSEIVNLKRQHVDRNDDDGGHETTGGFDLDISFGIFDFPWSKDGLISKSEDWKFEDVFFTSLIGTSTAAAGLSTEKANSELSGQLLRCNPGPLPPPWEEKYEANIRPPLEGEVPGTEWMDWSFLLNQPLQQGEQSSLL